MSLNMTSFQTAVHLSEKLVQLFPFDDSSEDSFAEELESKMHNDEDAEMREDEEASEEQTYEEWVAEMREDDEAEHLMDFYDEAERSKKIYESQI